MITISLDKSLDKEVFHDFWGFSTEGADFGKHGIMHIHPSITQENAGQYIDSYYQAHASDLVRVQHDLQTCIDASAEEYFSAIAHVFEHDYTGIRCTGLLSIFDCNPRYIDEKRFQVFYGRDLPGQREVVYHEVLHFIFFEHATTVCPDLTKNLDRNNGEYWALSEIFNVIVLNRPEFQTILKRREHMFYPALEKYVPTIQKLHEKYENNFYLFMKEGLTFLKQARQ